MRRRVVSLLASLVCVLLITSVAQAVVVRDAVSGKSYGIAPVPGQAMPPGSGSAADPRCDPWLSSDLRLTGSPLCWHGGSVMHRNETFVLTWDPHRWYYHGTQGYLEQFLRDVADSSGSRGSPYAVTGQYADGHADPNQAPEPPNPTGPNPNGQARHVSVFGGACVDNGSVGGSACQFGASAVNAAGNDYLPATGQNSGGYGDCLGANANVPCVTADAIAREVDQISSSTQLSTHVEPGSARTVAVLLPPGVDVCLDAQRSVCSANAATNPSFCSLHASTPGGIAYLVQPWTVNTSCDEPAIPQLQPDPTPDQVATDAGARLASPLSQAHVAAIVNPFLDGWYAGDGSEINDHLTGSSRDCKPLPRGLDQTSLGASAQNPYYLQREFNNASLIENDPNAYVCAPGVILTPRFVVPSAVNAGDEVQFDGSATASTLIVPRASYHWSFGDGATAGGPSVVHSYAHGGTYTVTLTVTDRGGNQARLTQTVSVLSSNGLPVLPSGTGRPNGGIHPTPGLRVRLQLMPQGLRALLRFGIALRVSSNRAAAGIATVSVSRAEGRRAHIWLGRGPIVVIGRGTVSAIKAGVGTLHVRIPPATARRLGHLRHVTLAVRLALVTAGRGRVALVAAGRY